LRELFPTKAVSSCVDILGGNWDGVIYLTRWEDRQEGGTLPKLNRRTEKEKFEQKIDTEESGRETKRRSISRRKNKKRETFR
jgi:hypothetical protein